MIETSRDSWFLFKVNFGYVVEAVQISVDQVSQAYANPKINLVSSAVTDLIPFLDKERKNNTPLFKAENGKIYRRSDINNLQDTKTIINWWGATTAMKFQWYKPDNSAI